MIRSKKPEPLFAAGTTVSAARSRAELEEIIQKYSKGKSQYSYGTTEHAAAVQFTIDTPKGTRMVHFKLDLPSQADFEKSKSRRRRRSSLNYDKWREQEVRRIWRCLVLQVKARFVELSMNLPGEDFDSIFLAHIVGNDGRTVYDALTSGVNSGIGMRLLTSCEK